MLAQLKNLSEKARTLLYRRVSVLYDDLEAEGIVDPAQFMFEYCRLYQERKQYCESRTVPVAFTQQMFEMSPRGFQNYMREKIEGPRDPKIWYKDGQGYWRKREKPRTVIVAGGTVGQDG